MKMKFFSGFAAMAIATFSLVSCGPELKKKPEEPSTPNVPEEEQSNPDNPDVVIKVTDWDSKELSAIDFGTLVKAANHPKITGSFVLDFEAKKANKPEISLKIQDDTNGVFSLKAGELQTESMLAVEDESARGAIYLHNATTGTHTAKLRVLYGGVIVKLPIKVEVKDGKADVIEQGTEAASQFKAFYMGQELKNGSSVTFFVPQWDNSGQWQAPILLKAPEGYSAKVELSGDIKAEHTAWCLGGQCVPGCVEIDAVPSGEHMIEYDITNLRDMKRPYKGEMKFTFKGADTYTLTLKLDLE